MKLFGNMGESSSPAGSPNTTDLKKTLRATLIVAGAAALGFLVKAVVGLDLYPSSSMDEMLITTFLVPLLELGRRSLTDYSKGNPLIAEQL